MSDGLIEDDGGRYELGRYDIGPTRIAAIGTNGTLKIGEGEPKIFMSNATQIRFNSNTPTPWVLQKEGQILYSGTIEPAPPEPEPKPEYLEYGRDIEL